MLFFARFFGTAALFSLGFTLGSPTRAHASPAPTKARMHVVGPGHLLIYLAKRYNVSVEDLQHANGLTPGQTLKIGTQLTIPDRNTPPAPATPTVHPVSYQRPEPPPPPVAPVAHIALPRGHVRLMRGADVWQGRVSDGRGHLSAGAVDGFSRLLRFGPTGKRAAVEPRLVGLLAKVSEHFGGRTLHVVSGFRPYKPTQYTPHSRHNLGAAADFSVEGVSNEALRDYCKTLPNVGVGYYPHSTFIHLDARTTFTTWVDYSRPGEQPRYAHSHRSNDEDESAADVSSEEETPNAGLR